MLPGSVVWVDLDPTVGREQAGRRPAVIVASSGYLDAVTELAIVVPATTTDRGWPQHVQLTGPRLTLARPTFAMTEQPCTISRQRIASVAGTATTPVWLQYGGGSTTFSMTPFRHRHKSRQVFGLRRRTVIRLTRRSHLCGTDSRHRH